MKPKIQNVAGMHDILPDDQKYYEKIYETAKEIADFYGFSRIETPILEDSDLFIKGTGMTTEIVQKQMFAFKTKGNDNVALRPEGTPPVVRAYLQHGMANWAPPVKLLVLGAVLPLRKTAGRPLPPVLAVGL